MIKKNIDGVEIVEVNCDFPEEELKLYIKQFDTFHYSRLTKLVLTSYDEDIECEKHYAPVEFDRIRRITGYLVGTVDRFNDAKRAEEHDRVKHGLPDEPYEPDFPDDDDGSADWCKNGF